MRKIGQIAAFSVGTLIAAAATAGAQSYYYPGTTYQTPPTYSYNSPYSYPGYGYYYSGGPAYGSYLGQPYSSPRPYSDPYVGYRPYSDNAGPKASD